MMRAPMPGAGAPQQPGNYFGNMAQNFGNAFGGQAPGAYQGAQNTINQYTQQGQNLLNPFIQAGQGAIGGISELQNQFSNPTQAYNQFMSKFQLSPGAQFALKNGMTSIQNAMAQNGLGGSGHEAEALSQFNQGLISQDMSQQWNNMLQGGKLGLDAGDTLYGGGLNAVGRAAGLYGQAGEDIAGLQEAQAQQQMAQQQQDNSDILGGIGTVGGWLFGGGTGGGLFGL